MRVMESTLIQQGQMSSAFKLTDLCNGKPHDTNVVALAGPRVSFKGDCVRSVSISLPAFETKKGKHTYQIIQGVDNFQYGSNAGLGIATAGVNAESERRLTDVQKWKSN